MAKRYRPPRYDRDGLDREYARNRRPRARTDRIYSIGGQVDPQHGNAASIFSEYQLEDRYHNPRRVELTTAFQCANHHTLGEHNRALGTCAECGAIVCGVRGCGATCFGCGRLVCRTHSLVCSRTGHTYIFCTEPSCRMRVVLTYSLNVLGWLHNKLLK